MRRFADLAAYKLPALALGVVCIVGVSVTLTVEVVTRRLGKQHDLDLAVQKAAVLQFPTVEKLLRAYPGSTFLRSMDKAGVSSYSFVADEGQWAFVVCTLPAWSREDDRVTFHGTPTLERFTIIIDDQCARASPGEPVTEDELDRIVSGKAATGEASRPPEESPALPEAGEAAPSRASSPARLDPAVPEARPWRAR